jgi:iron complex transport system substrate-binding protein
MRIITLFPAATEIVSALGALDQLVGVSHRCDYPPAALALPRVTRQQGTGNGEAGIGLAVQAEAVAGLAPDLIIAPPSTDVRREAGHLAKALGHEPRILVLDATSVDEILGSIQRVAEALGTPEKGAELTEVLREELSTVHQTLKAAGPPRRGVAVLDWLEPPTRARGWVPDLVRRAGGANALPGEGAEGGELTAQAIAGSGAEVVIFAPCGFDLRESADAAARLLASPGWASLRSLELWAVDARSLTSRPGPRIVDGVEALARMLHPSLFSPLDATCAVRLTPLPLGRPAAPTL